MIYDLAFPDPRYAADHGLVAIGGDYRPERLLAGYACGIFPWPSDELPDAPGAIAVSRMMLLRGHEGPSHEVTWTRQYRTS